jgi:hypothetical protein
MEVKYALLAERITAAPEVIPDLAPSRRDRLLNPIRRRICGPSFARHLHSRTITAENILDALMVRAFPATHPMLYLLVRLTAPTGAGINHRMFIRVVDDDGRQVGASSEKPVHMSSPGPGSPLYSTDISRILGITFHKEAQYSFEIHVDGVRFPGPTLDVLLVPRP